MSFAVGYLPRIVGYLGSAFNPLTLTPLQWLHDLISPTTIDDKTVNALVADLVQSNGVTLDGSVDVCSIDDAWNNAVKGSSATGYCQFYMKPTVGVLQNLIGIRGGSVRFDCNVDANGKITFDIRNTTGVIIAFLSSPNGAIVSGTKYKVKVIQDGAGVDVFFNDVEYSAWATEIRTDVAGWWDDQTTTCTANIGASSAGAAFYTGDIYDFKFCELDDTCLARFPMAEGAGLDALDTSGNGNDGLWTVGAGGVATLRSGLQDTVHRNLLSGYSLWEHAADPDILVPYGDDGNPLTFAKTGYTKTSDNPPVDIHNGCETKIKQKAANTEFLTNPFWSADGVSYDAKTFAQLRAHLNWGNNVVICSTASSITAAWTWTQAYEWTPVNYLNMLNYLATHGCTGTSMEPLIDVDGEYILNVNDGLIFAEA